ncbi:MAG: RNA polymerase sigma factor (sigma-70 family) [Planctomycetota bacterium]|jgi:RNA polymerase sigma factor (sigma-70 family)
MTQKRTQFNGIYEQYKTVVLAFLHHQMPHEADRDEVFQETWLDFYLGLDRGLPEQPRAYLLQIARRKVAKFRLSPKTTGLSTMSSIPAPDTQRDLSAILDLAIQSLEPDKRDVFVMKHRLGLDYREIATVLEIPKGTVASRLHHAIADLKASLQRAGLDCRIGESA